MFYKIGVLKTKLSYVLVLLYAIAMTKPVAPLFEYIIYEDYISEFLCINKNRTELSCKGKCYLMERLAEENEKKQQNLPKIGMEEYPIGFIKLTVLNLTTKIKDETSIHNRYINNYTFFSSNKTFRPPAHPL